jgi:hypothetical protein
MASLDASRKGRLNLRQNFARTLFHSPIVTSDLVPKIKLRDHGRGSDGSPSAKPVLPTDLFSRFWYLSSFKTGFCEVHLYETRARQGFQPDRRKKNHPKSGRSANPPQFAVFGENLFGGRIPQRT